MNKVLDILQKRDNMSLNSAKNLLNETREMIINNPNDADEIIADQLGLEPDYIFDILGY